MDWCEKNAVQYVFGLSKNETLDALSFAEADEVRTRRAIGDLDVVRNYAETRYAAQSWSRTLLIFMLKARRPARFRDNYVPPQNNRDGTTIVITGGLPEQ